MNNFCFTGHLTRDAEKKVTAQGLTILSFSVANNTGYGVKQKTNYVYCSLFGKRAEGRLIDYLKKGQEVATTGELNLNSFKKHDGQKSVSLECIVNGVDLLGGRKLTNNHGTSVAPPSGELQPSQRDTLANDIDIPF